MNDYGMYLLGALATLFSVVNPISTMPVFLALTVNSDKEHRDLMARKSAVLMILILIGFLLAGSFILKFFAISLEGIRIAGGLVIVRAGYALLNSIEKPNLSQESKTEGLTKPDISLTPLAIPLLAGPGSMAAVISMSTKADDIVRMVLIGLSIIIVAFTVFISFKYSAKALPIIGTSGLEALTKIMGFITMAIGVQFIMNGVLPILKMANAV
ncbi:MAG: NAAT family transporter [Bacteroidia bacterium]